MANTQKIIENIILEESLTAVDKALESVKSGEIPPGLEKYLSELLNEMKKFNLQEQGLVSFVKLQTDYKRLAYLGKVGYYWVMELRQAFTGEAIEYRVGQVTQGTLYYQHYANTKDFLLAQQPKLWRSWQSNYLKLTGSVKRASMERAYSETLSAEDMAFFTALKAKGNLNKGQLFEAFCCGKQLSHSYRMKNLNKIIQDAKNHIPFYKGGDLGNIQIKERHFFSIVNLYSIAKVLTLYIQIIKAATTKKERQKWLKILFTSSQAKTDAATTNKNLLSK